MKQLIALSVFILTGISCTMTNKESEPLYSQQMVELRALDNFLSNKKEQQLETAHWDYVPGLVANAVIKAWQQYPDKTKYYDAVKRYADHCLQGQDTIKVGESNIDDLAAGKIFFALYKKEMENGNSDDALRYRNCASFLVDKLKRQHNRIPASLPGAGGFFHKAVYPNQMWLDGLYMGPALYAEYYGNFATDFSPEEKTAAWSDIALQFKTIHHYTYDAEKQLNYHAWSATPADSNSFWARQEAPHLGCSQEFWGRGMGWYFAALVDVLEWMPAAHSDYATMRQILQEVAAGLARYQDQASGCWYQLLQYDASKTGTMKGDTLNGKVYNACDKPNYLESSASGMFTYAYYKGIRLGLLDKETYQALAQKAYKGLIEQFVRTNAEGKLDIIQSCASAGLGPAKDLSRTGTFHYYLCGKDVTVTQNEGKAVGPFIMASLEYELSTQY